MNLMQLLGWPKSAATLHKINSFTSVAELFGQPNNNYLQANQDTFVGFSSPI
jgi:hypothetical protein